MSICSANSVGPIVGGTRILIDAAHMPDTSPDDRAELDETRDSTQIG